MKLNLIWMPFFIILGLVIPLYFLLYLITHQLPGEHIGLDPSLIINTSCTGLDNFPKNKTSDIIFEISKNIIVIFWHTHS